MPHRIVSLCCGFSLLVASGCEIYVETDAGVWASSGQAAEAGFEEPLLPLFAEDSPKSETQIAEARRDQPRAR